MVKREILQIEFQKFPGPRPGSNPGPLDWQHSTLPTELSLRSLLWLKGIWFGLFSSSLGPNPSLQPSTWYSQLISITKRGNYTSSKSGEFARSSNVLKYPVLGKCREPNIIRWRVYLPWDQKQSFIIKKNQGSQIIKEACASFCLRLATDLSSILNGCI